jgi:hypothetical protein
MIHVKEIRAAVTGLSDDTPLNLRLTEAPTGLGISFNSIVEDEGHALIHASAFFAGELGDEEADEEAEALNVGDVRGAIDDLADGAGLYIRFTEAPDGLDVNFSRIGVDGGRAVIYGEASLPAGW